MLERVWGKGNPPTLLVGVEIGTATVENSMEVLERTRNKPIIWSSNPTPEYLSRENHNSKRHMYLNVHCSAIYDSQDVEAT